MKCTTTGRACHRSGQVHRARPGGSATSQAARRQVRGRQGPPHRQRLHASYDPGTSAARQDASQRLPGHAVIDEIYWHIANNSCICSICSVLFCLLAGMNQSKQHSYKWHCSSSFIATFTLLSAPQLPAQYTSP